MTASSQRLAFPTRTGSHQAPCRIRRSPDRSRHQHLRRAAVVIVYRCCLLWQDLDQTIDLVAGHRPALPFLPAVVWLSVSEPGAENYIGGKLMGRSVETPDGFEIEPGLRTLEVKKDGFVTYTNSVAFSAGSERRVNIVLQPVSAPSSPPAAR